VTPLRSRQLKLAISFTAIAALLWLLARPFSLVRVSSESMAPTLCVGDYLLLRDASKPANYIRGELIVFFDLDDMPVVKRIVGLANDEVHTDSDRAIVNGRMSSEPYACYPRMTPSVTTTHMLAYRRTTFVPQDTVFVMGDNRPLALDSRDMGPIPIDRIRGTVTIKIPMSAATGGCACRFH
jgi:signal peptidase I